MNLLIYVLSILPLGKGYTVSYLDCHQPNIVHRYHYDTLCNQELITNNETTSKYSLLQRVDKTYIAGQSCQITRSTFLLYCGAYSHNKIMRVPDIEINEPLEPSECRKLIYQRRYTAEDGQVYNLKMQEETVIKSQDLGIISEGDNAVSCQGQELSIGGHIIKDVIQISQVKITLLQQKYITTGNRVEVVADHLRLPRDCKKSSGGCVTAHATYIWPPPSPRCSLEKVQDLNMAHERGYLVDHQKKVVLKTGSVIPAPSRCPSVEILTTEYNDIFLAKGGDFTSIDDEVEIDVFSRALADYGVFMIETEINSQARKVQKNICQNKFLFSDDKIHRVHENSFASRKGDTVHIFKCAPRGGVIKQLPECYRDIPIEPKGFINSLTKVYQNHSAMTPCNKHFPMEILTREGWVSISPEIKKIDPPETLPLDNYKSHHIDLSKGGLYTPAELDSWRRNLEDGTYTEAVVGTLAYGTCVNSGSCGTTSSSVNYDLAKLNPFAKLEEELGFYEKIKAWLTENVVLLCVLVLLLEFIKLLITITVIVTTVIKEGVQGLKAIIIMTFCSGYENFRKLRKRARRNRNQEERERVRLERRDSAADVEMMDQSL